MASEYLTSNKEKCYLASYTHIDDDGEVVTHDVEFFIPLTKEEIENAKTALQVCKEEGIDIGDYYDNEEDIPYYMRMEDDVFGYHELNNIDLQTIGYKINKL